MRIGICGAHGTGKTTLANALRGALRLPLITEQARIAARDMGVTIQDVMQDAEIGKRFQGRLFRTQVRLEDNLRDGFVSDRTLADIYGYWRLYDLLRESRKEVFRWYVAEMLPKRYDILVYVPIEIPLVADGFRDTCPVCQRSVDAHIRDVINASAMQYLTVRGSVHQRVQQVLGEIWYLKKKANFTAAVS